MKRRPSSTGLPGGGARKSAGPPEEPEEEGGLTDPAARRVKFCYARERTRWESLRAGKDVKYVMPSRYDGLPAKTVEGEYVAEKRLKSVWLTLARWFSEREIDPETYINLQFDMLTTEDTYAPEPLQLMSPKYQARWRTCKHKIGERLRVQLVVQKRQAEREFAYLRATGCSPKKAWANALVTDGLALSPLFRYCLAVRLGGKTFDRLASCFEHDAVLQFERYRDFYAVYWAGLLPRDFAERSRRLYPELSSEHG